MQFQPFIRYVGGKRKQSEDIIAKMPTSIGTCYIPFLGGGSVMFQLLNSNIKFNRVVCSDIYQPLMSVWDMAKNNPDMLLDGYKDHFIQTEERGEDFYYETVEKFNTMYNIDGINDDNYNDIGIMFYYLTKSAVRGCLEYDAYGNFITKCQKFNNTDRYKISSPDTVEPILKRWSEAIQDVEFRCEDYMDTIKEAQDGDFVFLDPPYVDGTWYHDNNMEWMKFFKEIGDIPCDWGMTLNGDKDIYPIPETTGYTDHEYIYYGVKTSQLGRATGSRDSYWMKRTDNYEYDNTRKNVRQNQRGQGGSIPQVNDIKLFNNIIEKIDNLEHRINDMINMFEKYLNR